MLKKTTKLENLKEEKKRSHWLTLKTHLQRSSKGPPWCSSEIQTPPPAERTRGGTTKKDRREKKGEDGGQGRARLRISLTT